MKRTERLKKIFSAAIALTVAASSVFAVAWQEPAYGAENAGDSPQPDTQDVVLYFGEDKVIAHGGGSIDGFETTNSREAVEKAILDGYRYIELDMDLSRDDKVIMIHDWDRTAEHYFGRKFDKKLSSEEFSKILVNGRFKTLTFDRLVEIIKSAESRGITDIKIIADTKGDNIALLTAIAQQYPEYIKYIIPQIYDYGEYAPVKELGYDEIFFTLYMLEDAEFSQILDFVRTNDIEAVVVGTNYYVKGIDLKLAAAGIKVYCHPVNSFEEARALMDKGIYGVYSSFLLPGEFTGNASEYYLEQTDENGQKVKLTDVKLGMLTDAYLKSIKINGLQGGELLRYQFDGADMNEQVLTKCEDGLHKLTIEVFRQPNVIEMNDGEPYTAMNYLIWKCGDDLRLTDLKFGYRLEELRPLPQFDEVMYGDEANGTPGKISKEEQEINEILSGSLIVKKGEYYFYNNRQLLYYHAEDELLRVQSFSNGMAAIPLADTVKALGAVNVRMDNARYLYVTMNHGEQDYIAMAGAPYVYRGIKSLRMKSDVELYRHKAMASEEYFNFITGRPYIEGDDMAILLPENTKLTKSETEKLIKKAMELY